MKKFIIFVSGMFVLLVGIVLVLSNIDFNRLAKDNAYVQITKPNSVEEMKLDSGEIMTTYWYTLPAYHEDGRMIEVEFSASKELREEAYLMLYLTNEDNVTSYDEVTYEVYQRAVGGGA
ncbi:YxeA family protein [Sutcliffiella horikoshii]|uniref:YxeA family protein n=1 Tax=Sutcliffiella horikoshii TaxID=79883 RepID=A0AA95B6H0_9BACI|nr:YxeA family protein [Sutcliffiella horikoshii]TYS58571.1 YxeA family protein [Sutcliffiella horikoshii]